MSLVRWTPITRKPFFNIFDDVNRIMGHLDQYRQQNVEKDKHWHPALDIRENEENYIVTTDLPGMDKKDIEISLSNGVLTISGERKDVQSKDEHDCIRREVCYGKFSRSFTISEEVNQDEINAEFTNGVLKLTIGKVEPVKPEVKQIVIK